MKRPYKEDYFEYRGKTLIMNHGIAENFMDDQSYFIDEIMKYVNHSDNCDLVNAGFLIPKGKRNCICGLDKLLEK